MLVSIIACTNKLGVLDFIIANFNKQTYKEKELLIILGHKEQGEHLEELKQEYETENIKLYYYDDKEYNLGYCLNEGVRLSKGDLISKMDDDDYYSKVYLENAIKHHLISKADISGLSQFTTYIKEWNYLGLSKDSKQKCFIEIPQYLIGGTFIINRNVFDSLSFRVEDWKAGTDDMIFCFDAILKGFRLFSRANRDYMYVRTIDLSKHTNKNPNENIRNAMQQIDMSIYYQRLIDEYTKS